LKSLIGFIYFSQSGLLLFIIGRADILGALESQVLEQMGDPGNPLNLLGRTDICPGIERDDRSLMTRQDDKLPAVFQSELLNPGVDRYGEEFRFGALGRCG
jgi:hypothetical protein